MKFPSDELLRVATLAAAVCFSDSTCVQGIIAKPSSAIDSMPALKFYQVDAFSGVPFGGNSAAVCLLPTGTQLRDETLLKIAQEMNLSETAYIQPVSDGTESDLFVTCGRFTLRWFTPMDEVALCGHATLASAAALFQGERNTAETVLFDTRQSGQLAVKRLDSERVPLLQLTMPMNDPVDPLPEGLTPQSPLVKLVVGDTPVTALAFHAGLRYLVIQLRDGPGSLLDRIKPDMVALKALQKGSLPVFGIIVAIVPEDDSEHDQLLRFWAPWNLLWEDPVTGSAQSVVGPHLERVLGKRSMKARQASARGGELQVDVDRGACCVRAAGQAVIVLSGLLHL